GWAILLRQKQKKLIMLPSETMIWQPEFTDKTLSRKPGAVHVSVSIRSQLSAKFHIWLSTLSLWGYSGEGKHKVWLHGVTAPDRGASFIW
ncbi:hypothetical protein JR898_23850, partial [Escherichia coli]|uniref:hypothetical protein n=1 Tax=Escherichia coli TaxID=562 RepID=UPI0019CF90B7